MRWEASSSRAGAPSTRPPLPTPVWTSRTWFPPRPLSRLPDLVGGEPGEGFGHRPLEDIRLFLADQVAGDEAERRPEGGAFRFMSCFTVLSLPGDERVPRLGEPEQRASDGVPCRTPVRLLDGVDGRLLRVVECLETLRRYMKVPPLRHPFDAGGGAD